MPRQYRIDLREDLRRWSNNIKSHTSQLPLLLVFKDSHAVVIGMFHSLVPS
jgi:hypothetical protein